MMRPVLKQTALIGIWLGASLSMAVAVQAQKNESTARALTALDYFEIQQLVNRYAFAIDTCSNNGYDYADLFTADGFFAPFTNGQIGRKSQGREALARVSGGGPNGCTGAGWIRQGVKHIYVNHIINPTPEGASGQVNMLMIGLGGDKNRIEHDGAYYDTYEKTAQGWRFKSRIHHANYVPGGERGGAATTTGARGSQPAAPVAPPTAPGVQPAQPGR